MNYYHKIQNVKTKFQKLLLSTRYFNCNSYCLSILSIRVNSISNYTLYKNVFTGDGEKEVAG